MVKEPLQLKDLVLETIDEIDKEIAYNKSELHKDEIKFLKHSKERLATLFEALQAPKNKKFETKLNLILDYLQHSLEDIDNRLKYLLDADDNKK